MAVQAQLYSENLVFPLGGSQDLFLMENNAGGFNEFSFNLQQQQQQPQQYQQQQQNQQMQFLQLQNMQQNRNRRTSCFNKNVMRPENISPPMVVEQSPAPQMKKQRLDIIDPLITLQNERLRIAFEEHKRQQTILLKKYESEAQIILRQKDEEIAKAANRTTELNDFLKRMETENQAWQRLAKENEAIIATLNNSINQLRENACQTRNGVVDDAESCCDININTTEEKEKRRTVVEEGQESRKMMMICKSCNNSRNPCAIILLPCRHLCSCKFCEPYIISCPVCNFPKKGSIEALL